MNWESYSQVYKALLEVTKDTPGAKVENNKFCLSVHFRCVDEKVFNHLIMMYIYIYSIWDFGYKIKSFLKKYYFLSSFNFIVQKWMELAKEVGAVLDGYPNLKLTQGRKVTQYSYNVSHYFSVFRAYKVW